MKLHPLPALAVLAFAALTLASCKSDPAAPPSTGDGFDTTALMPLAVGNEWVIHHPFFTSNAYETLTVLRDTTIAGEKWYVTTQSIQTNRADGLYRWDTSSRRGVRQAKHPVKLGDTAIDSGWFLTIDPVSNAIDSTHNFAIVTALRVPVTVPAGTFTCWKALFYYYTVGPGHEPSTNTAYEYVYYAPGIGKVKEEALNGAVSSDNYVTSYELTKVTLK
jgi:hypothetical protein